DSDRRAQNGLELVNRNRRDAGKSAFPEYGAGLHESIRNPIPQARRRESSTARRRSVSTAFAPHCLLFSSSAPAGPPTQPSIPKKTPKASAQTNRRQSGDAYPVGATTSAKKPALSIFSFSLFWS